MTDTKTAADEAALSINAGPDGWEVSFDPARIVGRSKIVLAYCSTQEEARKVLDDTFRPYGVPHELMEIIEAQSEIRTEEEE